MAFPPSDSAARGASGRAAPAWAPVSQSVGAAGTPAAEDALPHRRAVALREGRDAGDLDLGEPGDRALTRGRGVRVHHGMQMSLHLPRDISHGMWRFAYIP
jgi:hypothetical protein